MIRFVLLLFVTLALHAADSGEATSTRTQTNQVQLLLQPSSSPLVTFRLIFRVGAASDPDGKEGVAALTAAMIAGGGSQKTTYEEILKRLYPMAADISAQVDKEMTVFVGMSHVENLQRYYRLMREMILSPGFRDEDFKRLKSDALNYLRVSLREGNDEELGKERLYNNIYARHPYEHHNVGTISSLEKLTVEDVKDFYRSNYTRTNLVIGLAGGFPEKFPELLADDFATLPGGERTKLDLPEPKATTGLKIDIIQRDTRSTAISLGFPIKVTRADDDFVALKLVESYFGQHRSSSSYLFQRLREARGLNYGDYAYIEYYPNGMFTMQPEPNRARHQQIFQIWIRPVPPEQAVFAFRAALFEFEKLVREGLSEEAFESTREFLSKFVDLLLQTQSASLGYALDSQFYGISDYRELIKSGLAKLTVDTVNRAIKRHLKSDALYAVFVTKDAVALQEALISGKPSPITYNSPKPDELLAEDKIIESFPIQVTTSAVTITPVKNVFE